MITKKHWLIVTHVPKKLLGAGTPIKTRLVHESDNRSLSRGHANLKMTTPRFLDFAGRFVLRLQMRDEVSLGWCLLEILIGDSINTLIFLGIQLCMKLFDTFCRNFQILA